MTTSVRLAVFIVWYIASLVPAIIIMEHAFYVRTQRFAYVFLGSAIGACLWIIWTG